MRHLFEPVYNNNSRILILGTFPSVKSRETGFYYGHKQNRFWKVIAAIVGIETPVTVADKTRMLLESGIAVWDVIESCDIKGSSDSSITNVVPADLSQILDNSDICMICANGAKAKQLFDRYQKRTLNREIVGLPSTSPANAAYSLSRLISEWSREISPLTIQNTNCTNNI